MSANSACTDTSGHADAFTTVSGGVGNQALSTAATIVGGETNGANDPFSIIAGGAAG